MCSRLCSQLNTRSYITVSVYLVIKRVQLFRACIILHEQCAGSVLKLDQWPMAMDHAVWIWNNLPSEGDGISPEEKFTSYKAESAQLQSFARSSRVGLTLLRPGSKAARWT